VSKLHICIILALAAVVGQFFATPEQIEEHFRSAQRELAMGDFGAAIADYRAVLSYRSNLLIDVGRVEVRIGERRVKVHTAAKYQLGQAHRLLAEELWTRADSLRRLGLPEEAEGDSARALEELERAGRWFREVYRDTSVEEELRAMAVYQMVEAWFGVGNYGRAAGTARKLLEEFPESRYAEDALYTLGWAEFHLGNYEGAVGAFDSLAARFPDGVHTDRAIFQAGECLVRLKRYDEAKERFGKVIARHDLSALSPRERAEMELARFRGTGEPTVRELVAKAYVKLGDCLAAQDSAQEALAAYRRAIVGYPGEVEVAKLAYIRMAQLRTEVEGYESGIAAYREAMEGVRDRVFQGRMQAEIMGLYYENGRYEEAVEEHRFYLASFGDVVGEVGVTPDEVLFRIGESYRRWAQELSEAGMADSAGTLLREAVAAYDSSESLEPEGYLVPDARFGKGFCLQALGDEDGARKVYRSLIRDFPGTPQAARSALQLARMAYDRGRLEEAAFMYDSLRADTTAPEDVRASASLEAGITYRKLGKLREAADALKDVPPGSEGFAGARVELVEVYLEMGDYVRARRAAGEGLGASLDPEVRASLKYSLGRVAYSEGRYGESEVYLREALSDSLPEELVPACMALHGISLYKLGETGPDTSCLSEAASELREVLDLPLTQDLKLCVLRTLGLAMARSGRTEEAVRFFRSRAEGDELWRLALAQLLLDAGRPKEAADVASGLVDDPKLGAEACRVSGKALLAAGEPEGAAEAFRKGLGRDPDSSDLRLGLGVALFASGRYGEAEDVLADLLKETDDPTAWYYLGYTYHALSEYERAAYAFAKVREGRYSEEAEFMAAEDLYNSGRFDEALRMYRRVAAKGGRFADDAAFASGWCLWEMGREEEAMEAFRRLAAERPDSPYAPKALLTLGDYGYNRGRYDEARRNYSELVKLYPDSEEARVARRLLRELREIEADREYRRAMELFDEGRYGEAVRALTKVIEDYPGTLSEVAAWCNLGVAYERLRMWREAVAAYDSALARAGRDPELSDAASFAGAHRDWVLRNRL